MDNQDITVVDVPYLGVKLAHNRLDLTVKLHGPNRVFVNTVQLKQVCTDYVGLYHSVNIQDICEKLSDHIRDKYCDGRDITWVQVDLTAPNGVVCGASADRALL